MTKKNFARILSCGIVLILILSLATGCGKVETGSNTTSQSSASGSTGQETSGNKEDNSGKVTDKPIEISVLMPGRPEGPISNDMPIVKEIMNRTGITFKWEQAPSDGNQYSEKFNILVAGGDIPDIMINSDKLVIIRGGMNGVFEPLNDYLDKYMPNVVAKFEEKPDVKKTVTNYDGKIYCLTRMTAVKPANILIIRKDWLDKLGLEVPTTAEEMYNVLKAFKEKDPNGNGKPDEIPFTCRGKLSSLSPFFEAFGIYSKDAFFVEDGQVKFSYTDPRFKEGLEYVAKLYKEKLIDNEYLTNDLNIWQSRLTTDISGMTYDMFVRVDYLNNLMPEPVFEGMIPLKDPEGVAATKDQQNPTGKFAAISSKSKYKVEIAKFFNWMYSEEGILLTNFGVEGLTYQMVNGQPKYTDLVMKDPNNSALVQLFSLGFRDNWPYYTDVRYENEMGSECQNKLRDTIDKYIIPKYPMTSFTYIDEEQKVMTNVYTQIQTYYEEMINKFIMGTEPLDKFDEFVEKINQLGLPEVLKVQQAAYDRYSSN